ncbi:unnamed protein product [Phyllotreta striolata]|uniref:TIL domain-containing protein n=1 Tax=Phyllotreta striolata TaxID=444603 RepID=A0A9N9XUP3_PHYSR|nr:unnamed protein product [Phyllotreta striolata]
MFTNLVLILTAAVLSYSSSEDCSTEDSPCGKFETLNTCSSPCAIPATCDFPYPSTTSDTCIERCDTVCECIPEYVKINENGPCIKTEDCPNKNRCGVNEVIGCVHCCEVTCLDLNKCDEVICPTVCIEGCTCRKGFVLDRPNGTCVPITQCSE